MQYSLFITTNSLISLLNSHNIVLLKDACVHDNQTLSINRSQNNTPEILGQPGTPNSDCWTVHIQKTRVGRHSRFF